VDDSFQVRRSAVERLVVTCPMELARATDEHYQALGYRWVRSGSKRTGPGTVDTRVYEVVLERELEPARLEAPWTELWKLAIEHPTVNAALSAYRAGQVSWQEMLWLALKVTTQNLDSAQAVFEEHLRHCPPSVIRGAGGV
jgi:hypothetical protein